MVGIRKGTPVYISSTETKPIEEIKVGDKVLAYNEETKRYVKQEVINTFKFYCEELTKYVFENKVELVGCEDLVFLTKGGWKENIEIGDEVICKNGNTKLISEEIIGKEEVYELDIEPIDNYLVNGIVIHNLSLCPNCHTRSYNDTKNICDNCGYSKLITISSPWVIDISRSDVRLEQAKNIYINTAPLTTHCYSDIPKDYLSDYLNENNNSYIRYSYSKSLPADSLQLVNPFIQPYVFMAKLGAVPGMELLWKGEYVDGDNWQIESWSEGSADPYYWDKTTESIFKITRTDSSLKIQHLKNTGTKNSHPTGSVLEDTWTPTVGSDNGKTWIASDFIDDVIPTKLFFIIQGGGGRGGNSTSVTINGSGGGAGGLAWGIIPLFNDEPVFVAAGCYGGCSNTLDGGDSWVGYSRSYSDGKAFSAYQFSSKSYAFGGNAGANGTTSSSKTPGGQGAKVSSITLGNISGGGGGPGTNGNGRDTPEYDRNGDNVTAYKISIPYLSSNPALIQQQSGGGNGNSYAGGGGASGSASGGNGGIDGDKNGKAGYLGSGGGGGRANGGKGGTGGRGYVMLFY